MVTILLLVWIFHVIFMEQGQTVTNTSEDWNTLTRWEQWKIAWTYGPKALWRVFALSSLGLFAVSFLCVGVTIVVGAWRWHLLLRAQGIVISFARTSSITMIGQFFNSFLLGSTGGDILKAYYGTKETEKSKTEAVTAVLADRLLGLFFMLLFAVFFMFPNMHLLLVNKRLTLLTLFTLGMFLVCLLLVLAAGHGKLLSKILDFFSKRTFLQRALEACKKMARQKTLILKVFFLSMLLNAFCVLQFYTIAYDLGLHIAMIQLAVIVPMIICISSLPITPSGLGVRENLYVIMLGAPMLAIPPTQALALSLTAYAGYLCWSVVGAGFYLFYRANSGHLAQLKKAK